MPTTINRQGTRKHQLIRYAGEIPPAAWECFVTEAEAVLQRYAAVVGRDNLHVTRTNGDWGLDASAEYLYLRTPAIEADTRDLTLYRVAPEWSGLPTSLRVYADPSPAGVLVEMLLMLLARHCPEAFEVRSVYGPREWAAPTWHLLATTTPGPWVGLNIDGPPDALPASPPPLSEVGKPRRSPRRSRLFAVPRRSQA